MTPLKLALCAATATIAFAAPAAAQMNHANMPGMNMPGMTMPMPAKKPAARKPAPKKPAATAQTKRATTRKPTPPASKAKAAAPASAGSTCLPEHAAMGHCTLPATSSAAAAPASSAGAAKPVISAPATCLPEHAALGHCTLPPAAQPATPAQQPATPAQPACPPEHAAMGHCTPAATQSPAEAAAGTDLPAGNAPPPPIPTANAADAIYGAQAMNMGRHHLAQFHGGQKFFQALVNVAEVQFRKGREAFEWDGEAWYGGDINRLWLKSEGEGEFGGALEKAEVQALYSRAIGPYFNLQGGVRYDIKPNPSRAYATVGVEGLAPSFFDLEAALFLSNKGEVMARAEGSYDQRITQRLILQPRAELNFAAQNSREIGVGAGLSDAELGLRLRYDIRREFAPYVGVQYRRAFGRTRDYLRDEGERASSWSLLTGIRMWF